MLLHEVVEFAARRTPGATALIVGDRRWTFASLWAEIVEFSEWIAARTEPGDRVCVISDNRPEVVVALYAVPRAGAVAMFANTRLVPSEIIDLMGDVAPTVVVGSAQQLDRIRPLLADVRSVNTVVTFEDRVPDDPEPVGMDHASGSDRRTAWIIHTSGTTGRPKGAMLTHRNLLTGVLATALARPMGPGDSYLFPFPLFHVAAYGVVHAHFRGRPVVLVPKFDAIDVMAAIEAHRVTTISLAPTMIAMLLDHPDRERFDLSSLRHIFYGASAIPLDVLQRGLAEFGCGFGQGYGMTELSGNAAFLDADAHRRAASDRPDLLVAAGVIGPLASIRLVRVDSDGVDRADGALVDVDLGDAGEIVIRGDQVISGYWNQPEATAAAFVDGWFRTGDIGRLDADGHLFIVDRLKDLIVSGGENVASREVEDVLSTHPAVAQIAVVGLAHDRWGEQVVALVVPNPATTDDPEDILDWARDRLAGFKRPRRLAFVDALPLNASGKIVKAEVRSMAAGIFA